jgi:hypothetical protein
MKYEIEIPDGKYCGDCLLMNHDSEWGNSCNLTGDELRVDIEPNFIEEIKSEKCPGVKNVIST